MSSLPHLVHIRPSFGHGGAETRIANLINHTRTIFRHSLVVLDGNFTALNLVEDRDAVSCTTCLNTRNPVQMIAKFRKLLRGLRPDLVLTYNWGSMDAAAAARLLPGTPLIHTEDGFNADEVSIQKRRRILMRQAVLGGAYCVVAPSQTLMHIMRTAWRLPQQKIRYIPNGVDINRFQPGSGTSGIELVIGTVGSLTAVKRQSLLLEVFAGVAKKAAVRLMIAGQGPLRADLEARAGAMGIADRVEFLGYQPDATKIYEKLDVFAMSSVTEQMPMAILEAMACGLPIVSTDVGDIKHMVSAKNRSLITSEAELGQAMETLVGDGKIRCELGRQNREHCVRVNSIDSMCGAYVALYKGAMARGSKR